MRIFVGAAAAVAVAASAAADPIVYSGELFNAVPAVGAVPLNGDGNGVDNPSDWDWWYFYAETGNAVSIVIDRLTGDIDPASSAHFAGAVLPGDTAPMLTVFDFPAGTVFMGSGDDNDPPNVPGPFGDPNYGFVATGTGWHTVAVANFLGTPGPGEYQIVVRGITPEPGSLALLSVGLLALARRR